MLVPSSLQRGMPERLTVGRACMLPAPYSPYALVYSG